MTVQELITRLECVEDKSYEVLMEPDDSTLLGIKKALTCKSTKTVWLVRE